MEQWIPLRWRIFAVDYYTQNALRENLLGYPYILLKTLDYSFPSELFQEIYTGKLFKYF